MSELKSYTFDVFPAKLLLFGEYAIIQGSDALAIPFDNYGGRWARLEPSIALVPFFEYLKTLPGALIPQLDVAIRAGWTFVSSIPLGYGLGSSGALSAAAYQKFFTKPNSQELDLLTLKNILGQIESYFHGKSSGLDPLTSYTRKAIHIKDGLTQLAPPLALPSSLRLYNSQLTREGRPLIAHYLQLMDQDQSFIKANHKLKDLNKYIIDCILKEEDITALFKEISLLQFQFFKRMIPESIASVWQKGLAEESYYMKLSGAGGGGFFLMQDIESSLEDHAHIFNI